MFRNNFIRCAGLAVVLGAALFPRPGLRSESAAPAMPGRYLFIFDTSANMKNRAPAMQQAVTTMLATSMGGELHTGDTLGVWTLDQELHPGDFPLHVWDADDAASIAGNINDFIASRKYANKTRFEALQPLLNQVKRSSERLTVVIFCDGATKITGTTFDTGINQLFDQNVAAQKKARQPFVVLLRSQLGKYIGCTVSYPPQLVSFPQFPPLPPPPVVPKPATVVAPVVAPVVVTPSLFITGTNIENRLVPPVVKPAPPNPPPAVEHAPATIVPPSSPVSAPPVIPVAPSNPPSAALPGVPVAPPLNPPVPAAAPVAIPSANPTVPTNPPAIIPAAVPVVPASAQAPAPTKNPVAAENPADSGKKTMLIVAVCLLSAGLLTAVVALYFRRPDRRSLISSSMQDK